MSLARSTLKLVLSRGLSAPITFLGLAYFAQQLGPASMGVYFLFLTIIGFSSIIFDFGLRGAIEKRLSEGVAPEAVLGTGIALKMFFLVISTLIFIIARGPINEYVGSDIVPYLIVGLIVKEFGNLMLFVLRGELRVGETATLQATRSVLLIAFGVFFITFELDINGVLYGYILAWAVMGVWGLSKISMDFGWPTIETARSLISFAKYNVISGAGGQLYNWLDVAVVGFFLTQSAVGTYGYAWRVSALVMFLSNSVATAIFPHISNWSTGKEGEEIESLITQSIGTVLFIAIPALFGAVVFADEILHFMFGGAFVVAAPALVILMGEKILQSTSLVLGRSLDGLNQVGASAKITIFAGIANLGFNLVLVPFFGITGAAVATAGSVAVNGVLNAHYLSNFIELQLPYKLIGWYILGSVVMFVVIWSLQLVYPVTNPISLVVEITIGVGVYLGFSVLVPTLRNRVIRPGVEAVVHSA